MIDGKDLNDYDLRSLRRQIDTVLQDGKLFQGDIYFNIVIAATWIDEERALKAAEITGLKEDLEKMPMGIHTMINGNSNGVSGGQKQRIMIARAIVNDPKIIIFDEATSALDNSTQKMVSTNLDQMDCSRIVVAHRLSTIRNCDRIIMLEDGKIVEDGTYEQLISNQAQFADMVARQQIETEGEDNG